MMAWPALGPVVRGTIYRLRVRTVAFNGKPAGRATASIWPLMGMMVFAWSRAHAPVQSMKWADSIVRVGVSIRTHEGALLVETTGESGSR